MHPTCWGSSQWSHTVSSTPCPRAWKSAPISAHLSIEYKCTALQIETPTVFAICNHRTTTHQFIWQQQHTCGAVGGLPMECGVNGQTYKAPHFHPRHRGTHPPEWPSQEEPGSGVTVSALVSDVSASACTNGVWSPLWPVSVAQKNKRRSCCPSMSNPSTSLWTARIDGSGRWDNRTAAQHLPRDLVQQSSGVKNSLKRWRSLN